MITFEFPDNAEKYMGYAEASIGFGCMLGPVIGSLFYMFLDYLYTFVAFGVILLLCTIPISIILPNDRKAERTESQSKQENMSSNQK